MSSYKGIHLDNFLLERLQPLFKDIGKFLEVLRRPPRYLYVRINTIKVGIEEYKSMLKERSVPFVQDTDIPEALGFRVHGPNNISYNKNLKKVIVDKKAAESVVMGSDLYAPGIVLAKNVKKGDKVVVLGPNGEPVASGVAVMDETDILKKRGLAVRVTRSLYTTVKLSELPGSSEGYFYAQSLPSMVAIRMLDPKPGELIVDLTAAPGGKISYVAQLTGPSSRIIAFDRKSKVKKLKKTLMNLGIDWVEVIGADSRYIDKKFPNLVNKVDKVLVDPPCSNLGIRPKLTESKTFRDVIAVAMYQRAFIKVAKNLLKKGGKMLYSTCTVTWEENELNVDFAEEQGFRVVDPPLWVKRRWSFNKKGVRFCPIRDDLPGFFASILEI